MRPSHLEICLPMGAHEKNHGTMNWISLIRSLATVSMIVGLVDFAANDDDAALDCVFQEKTRVCSVSFVSL